MIQNKKICLVVPCYNEEKRIDITAFEKFSDRILFVFVDDGSTDGTLKLLNSHVSDDILVHSLERNSGKAEAVRRGMLFAESNDALKDIEWFGFWDADLATPLEEVHNFLLYRDKMYPDAIAVFGSRVCRLGARIRRSFLRHLAGRLFATFTAILFKVGSYDSQCGAKLFKRGCLERAFGEVFVTRWIFDLEIIIRLKGCCVVEYPLNQWVDVGGSKLMSLGGFTTIACDITRLWKKYQ